jgi:hypothetical protein
VYRSAKQCREHWNCYLNPQLKKGPWTIDEDILLLTLIRGNNGDKKWSEIVFSFEGRTENALKNRYTLLIDKQKKFSKSKQEKALIEDCLQRCKQMQTVCTREQRSTFISEIFKEEHTQKEHQSPVETNESLEMQDSHRGDSQTIVETPQPQPRMMIRLCKLEEFDFLRQMAMSREVRPGVVRNGSFQPER